MATIDGAPAPESALAPALRAEGFAARRGALVRLVERRGELGGLGEERERGEKSVSEERRA